MSDDGIIRLGRLRPKGHRCEVADQDEKLYLPGTVWRCECGRRWQVIPRRYSTFGVGDPEENGTGVWRRRYWPWPR